MTDQAIVEKTDVSAAIAALKDKFAEVVKDDNRAGYSGIIIDKNHLVEVEPVPEHQKYGHKS